MMLSGGTTFGRGCIQKSLAPSAARRRKAVGRDVTLAERRHCLEGVLWQERPHFSLAVSEYIVILHIFWNTTKGGYLYTSFYHIVVYIAPLYAS